MPPYSQQSQIALPTGLEYIAYMPTRMNHDHCLRQRCCGQQPLRFAR